jgi:hypothetical protein
MSYKIPASGEWVFGGAFHLSDHVQHRAPHCQQGDIVAVMQMQIVVLNSGSTLDQEPECHVESFFSGTPNPKESVRGLGHFYQAFFQHSTSNHELEVLPAEASILKGLCWMRLHGCS